jgi:hypothetical protein
MSSKSPDKHIQQIGASPPTSEVLPVENHSEPPEMLVLQLLDVRDHLLTDIQEEVVEMLEKSMDKPNPPSSQHYQNQNQCRYASP